MSYDKAGIAQLVERNLAKVEVESSRLFSRSIYLGLIIAIMAVLFFNNLEEVVKIYQSN